MRILVVGAGAVGQVYAYHFWKGGAQVGFLVREKYAKDLRDKPCVLHQLSQFRSTRPVLFKEYQVVSRLDEVKADNWNVVVLTISSAALRDGTWLLDFLASLPPNATLVSLASGFEDRKLILAAGFPRDRLVDGFITFSSWQAPLPEEKTHPVGPIPWKDTNQPLGYLTTSPLPFTGAKSLVGPITSTLSKGGLWSLRIPPQFYDGLFGLPAISTPLLVALEAEKWSFHRLARSSLIPVTARAIGESLVVTAKHLDLPWVAYFRFFIWGIGLRIFLLLTLWVMPFDFEAFTKYHFQKVGNQTKLFHDAYINQGKAQKVPTKNMEALAKRNPRWS